MLKVCSCPRVRVGHRAAGLVPGMSRGLTGVDDPGTMGERPMGRFASGALAHANVEAVWPLTNEDSVISGS